MGRVHRHLFQQLRRRSRRLRKLPVAVQSGSASTEPWRTATITGDYPWRTPAKGAGSTQGASSQAAATSSDASSVRGGGGGERIVEQSGGTGSPAVATSTAEDSMAAATGEGAASTGRQTSTSSSSTILSHMRQGHESQASQPRRMVWGMQVAAEMQRN